MQIDTLYVVQYIIWSDLGNRPVMLLSSFRYTVLHGNEVNTIFKAEALYFSCSVKLLAQYLLFASYYAVNRLFYDNSSIVCR